MYDALPARDIVVPEGHDTLKLLPGEECQAYFANQLYSARVVAVGKMYILVMDVLPACICHFKLEYLSMSFLCCVPMHSLMCVYPSPHNLCSCTLCLHVHVCTLFEVNY